uniref:WIF domain-containing protein n=1 Tax=Timema genevievae TaxID=629358 RepID=A0A7R9PKL8_TIMGE|nr:unnamed protein product [Timema genevievae]
MFGQDNYYILLDTLEGLNAELFYVRDGVVNDYALNFSVPVPAHISELYFIWQSLTGMPLPYVVELRVSDNEALVAPLLNISHTGHIPVVAEAFMVSLSCSKAVDAEVDVILNLNISLNKLANNITTLTFRRKKICLKGCNILYKFLYTFMYKKLCRVYQA